MGLSRFGAGGVFASEHGYSLVADGFGSVSDYDGSLKLTGNGDALHVKGRSLFQGPVKISGVDSGEEKASSSIVELFELDNVEYISPGDVLVVSELGNSILSKSRNAYDRSVIGIVASDPVIIINNSGKEEKVYPVALTGKVMCRIDARNNPVKPGDLIVTSSTPGCGMAGKLNSFEKIGTVIGKALDHMADGIGLVPVFITHL